VPSSVTVVNGPQHGSAAVDSATGKITYTAAAGFGGTDSFRYSVRDDHGTSHVATAFVRVNVPIAADDFGQTQDTQPVSLDVLANDTDPDGNEHLVPASVRVVAGPQHGSIAVDPATGKITYTPVAGFGGSDTFKYTVSDDHGATSAPATVTVITTLADGTTPGAPPTPAQQVGSVSTAFGPQGQVLVFVSPSGLLTQFDATGAHTLRGNVRSASVAFGPAGEVLVVVFQNGTLIQVDATGVHSLGGGVRSASVAFGPGGEVLDVVSQDGTLTQFSAAGALSLGGGVASASAAFGPRGQVLDVVFQDGTLMRLSALGPQTLARGVVSSSVAFVPSGEVLDVLFQDGSLFQFDALGAHALGRVF